MSALPRWGVYAYLSMMAFGVFIAMLGIESAIENGVAHSKQYPDRAWWGYPVLSSGGTGVVLVLTTLAFLVVLIRRGGHALAPLAYAMSYLATGFGFFVIFLGIEKRGAPGTMADVYAGMPLYLTPGILIATLSLVWLYRKSSKTPSNTR
ncbi:MAG TPA: hypothetical protein VJ750_06370 [Rhizomicrobium sp.]|nr:hypothetical protein [Rhizomicrobium sp.]